MFSIFHRNLWYLKKNWADWDPKKWMAFNKKTVLFAKLVFTCVWPSLIQLLSLWTFMDLPPAQTLFASRDAKLWFPGGKWKPRPDTGKLANFSCTWSINGYSFPHRRPQRLTKNVSGKHSQNNTKIIQNHGVTHRLDVFFFRFYHLFFSYRKTCPWHRQKALQSDLSARLPQCLVASADLPVALWKVWNIKNLKIYIPKAGETWNSVYHICIICV